jgi:hypothetical protein
MSKRFRPVDLGTQVNLLFPGESVSLVDEDQVHAEASAGLALTIHPEPGHVVAGAFMRRKGMDLRRDLSGERKRHGCLA